MDKSLFFNIDVENIILGKHINKPYDYRTLYSILHGLESISRRVEVFEALLDAKEFSIKQRHELQGRLADQFSRFASLGFEYINKDGAFTSLGKKYFGNMYDNCANSLERLNWVNKFNMTWRDLDFRYCEFVKYNPINEFI